MTPLILFLVLACGEPAPKPAPAVDLGDRIAFAPAEPADRVPVTVLPAEIVPAPGAVHEIGPAVAVRLTRWRVEPGQTVASGDPLAEFQSPDLTALEGRAAELAATVAQQTRLVEVRRAARDRGVASAADLHEAEGALQEATAAHAAVLRDLRAVSDTATRSGDTWIWRAPSNGVVSEIQCRLGTVEAARSCLTVVQPEGVLLEVRVPERHLAELPSGVEARFTSADGREWAFVEQSRAPAVDPRARSLAFRFDTVGAAPLPGMSGRAELTAPAHDVLAIPSEALTRIEGQPTVFVRDGEGGTPRSVQVIGRDATRAYVRGLEPADEVAVRGVFLLKSLALLEEAS